MEQPLSTDAKQLLEQLQESSLAFVRREAALAASFDAYPLPHRNSFWTAGRKISRKTSLGS